MVSSPRPPRPGPAATTTAARKPSARCASALGWVVAMNVLLAATQIAVGSGVKSLALVADGATAAMVGSSISRIKKINFFGPHEVSH